MESSLADLIQGSGSSAHIARGSEVRIRDIQYASPRVSDQALFCVLGGMHSHGKYYIQDAIAAGASALLIEESVYHEVKSQLPQQLGVCMVPAHGVRREMSRLAKYFFSLHISTQSQPRSLPFPKSIGITGTDGKTSTIQFLHQLAAALNIRAGYWSTIDCHDGIQQLPNLYRQSTPESPDIYRMLARMRENGCVLAFLEATSHGLSPKTARMIDVEFSFAGLTNIGHEHLDFHGTVENYARDKGRLFAQLRGSAAAPAAGLLRYEEPYRSLFTQMAMEGSAGNQAAARADGSANHETAPRILSYSCSNPNADYYFKVAEQTLHCSRGHIQCRQHPQDQDLAVTFNLVGNYNIENALLAIALMHVLTQTLAKESSISPVDLADICALSSELRSPEGRLQVLHHDAPFTAIVDYAHTPGSFTQLLPMLRRHCSARLIVVFGSAGERDKQKRSMLGQIADKHADIIVLCDEDPRGEDPTLILREIAAGCSAHVEKETLFLIPEREKAIAFAISLAQKDDCLVFLGKGHEKSIEYASGDIVWDESAVVQKYLHTCYHKTKP